MHTHTQTQVSSKEIYRANKAGARLLSQQNLDSIKRSQHNCKTLSLCPDWLIRDSRQKPNGGENL